MTQFPDSRGRARFAFLLTLALVTFASTASSQAPREQVRVPKRHANIQAGPSSGSIVLVLVPQGTVLTVIERQGPWVVVELTPKLREVGTPMRWYRGEKRGYMHESTVESVKSGQVGQVGRVGLVGGFRGRAATA